FLLLAGFTQSSAARRVAVLYADSSKHTLRTIAGLEWSLRGCNPPCSLVVHYLKAQDQAQVAAINSYKPELLVTIGSTATAFADRGFPSLPIVFAKVLNPIESVFITSWVKPGCHLSGTALDIPV